MKNHKIRGLFSSSLAGMTRLAAVLWLLCMWSVEATAATAPRITPGLFGEEQKADIVGYQLAPLDAAAKSDGEAALEIVNEAFKAAEETVTVDVLPAKQLALYALLNNEAAALIGSQQDLPEKDKNQYRMVAFYLRVAAPSEEPLALIFGKKHSRTNELLQVFNEGLQKLVKSGKYLEILEKHYGKGQVPADYVSRLQRHNSGLK